MALYQPGDGPVLLASGSYDDATAIGLINTDNNLGANVFTGERGGLDTEMADVVTQVTILPEPVTLGLVLMGGLALLRGRRRLLKG